MENKKYRQGSEDYLINTTDDIINKLVVEKTHLFNYGIIRCFCQGNHQVQNILGQISFS